MQHNVCRDAEFRTGAAGRGAWRRLAAATVFVPAIVPPILPRAQKSTHHKIGWGLLLVHHLAPQHQSTLDLN